jgi:imidazolonepropionase-like amidohydrolase
MIENGVVLVNEKGLIESVGKAGEVRIPDGTKVLRAKVAIPGLDDAHTVVGLACY